jgi:hypothetical protein
MQMQGSRLRWLALAVAPVIAACGSDGPTGDREPPVVVATSPTTNATGVARNTTITVTFDEAIAQPSVSLPQFRVQAPGGPVVGGTLNVNGATIVFTPGAALAFGTTYTVTIGTGITDVAGNELAAAHSWSFTTVANPLPTVTATTPAAGATNVARNTTVTATFSEAVTPASVTAATFTVTPTGGAAIAGTIAVNGATVTFTPSAQLALGTTYTARLTTGITDLDGGALAADFTWTFSTPVNTAPSANAGATQDVNRGATVQLAGSGTDPENETLTYRWTQVFGPDVTGGAGFLTGATPTFTAPSIVSSVRFELRVTDASGATSQASIVQVNVMEDLAHAIFVSPLGDDLNNGTSRTTPVRTITTGIARAVTAGAGTDVYVVNGTYTGSIGLASGVSIYGGYQSGTWLRDRDQYPTTITGGTSGIAVSGGNVTDVTLDGLGITAPDFNATGQSIYGVYLSQAQNIRITNNRITAGEAGPGSGGQFGVSGVHGMRGSDGTNASCSGTPQRGLGGIGGAIGGGGGGTGFVGGDGGAGGAAGVAPVPGRSGNGISAGPGGQTGFLNNPLGVNGGNGSDGSDGFHGTGGASFGAVSTAGYVPADGTAGNRANPGASGGGGGGGFSEPGGAGGGGGGGGASGGWGGGGNGGAGGGGSFAILVLTSTGVTIDNNVLITGKGGPGGTGGAGGAPGIGALGGAGGFGCGVGGSGGPGGKGGNGGRGGHGGGGGGGPSIGILEDAASAVTIGGGNTYQIGTAGAGGFTQGNMGASGISTQTRKQP